MPVCRVKLREPTLSQTQIFALTGIDSVNLQNWANRGIIKPHRPIISSGGLGRRRYSIVDAAKVKMALDLISVGVSTRNASWITTSVDAYADAERGAGRDRGKYPEPVKYKIVVIPRRYADYSSIPPPEFDGSIGFFDDSGILRIGQRTVTYEEFVEASPIRIEVDVTALVENIISDLEAGNA